MKNNSEFESGTGSGTEITAVVHDAEFHADDVFAAATLKLFLAAISDSRPLKIVRTRDEGIIKSADYVMDVGGVYDPANNRFDHHQVGGAENRPNGIPYAAFGLVWKQFGEKISGSKEVAQIIDERMCAPMDAIDNGVSIYEEIFPGIRPYDIQKMLWIMNPAWNESRDKLDETFLKAVELAQGILSREIKLAQGYLDAEKFVIEAYKNSSDKRLVIFDKIYPWEKTLSKFSEPLFVIYPKDNWWRVKAVRNDSGSFVNRKDFPKAWSGKRDEEFVKITGVSDAVFCHKMLFLAVARSKEGALALAKIALKA